MSENKSKNEPEQHRRDFVAMGCAAVTGLAAGFAGGMVYEKGQRSRIAEETHALLRRFEELQGTLDEIGSHVHVPVSKRIHSAEAVYAELQKMTHTFPDILSSVSVQERHEEVLGKCRDITRILKQYKQDVDEEREAQRHGFRRTLQLDSF